MEEDIRNILLEIWEYYDEPDKVAYFRDMANYDNEAMLDIIYDQLYEEGWDETEVDHYGSKEIECIAAEVAKEILNGY